MKQSLDYFQTTDWALPSSFMPLESCICLTVLVTQLCPTLCDPMDWSPSGSSVHWILQARILEWITISFSRGSSRPRDWTQVSYIAGRLYHLSQRSPFFVTSGDADHCCFFSLLPLIKLLSYFYRLRVWGIELCSTSVVIYYLKYIMTWQWRRKWQPTLVFLPGKNPWTEKPDGLQSMGSPNIWTWLSHLSNNKMACQNEKNVHFFSKTSSPSNAYL